MAPIPFSTPYDRLRPMACEASMPELRTFVAGPAGGTIYVRPLRLASGPRLAHQRKPWLSPVVVVEHKAAMRTYSARRQA